MLRGALPGRCSLRLPAQQRARGPFVRPPRQRARHAEVRRHRRGLYLGRGSPARRPLGRDDHLRDPRARHDHAPPVDSGAPARHLRRARPSGGGRPPGRARHHRDRADADPRLRPGSAPARPRPEQLLGLQLDRLLRARAARYLAGGAVGEFKTMVKRFHNAGIEVILDVVYNHTAEATTSGRRCRSRASTTPPTTASCPTTPASTSTTPVPRRSTPGHPGGADGHRLAALLGREKMHVDGFRFDLAATLGARTAASIQRRLLRRDPAGPGAGRRQADRRAWDIGPGGYQVGNFPPGWFELNDRFRDVVRQFWKGDEGILPELRRPADRVGRSVRASRPARLDQRQQDHLHDGFTLKDVVSYNRKHNEANGENRSRTGTTRTIPGTMGSRGRPTTRR